MAAKIWKVKSLASTAKFVLLALTNHCNKEGKAWPSQQVLAEETNFNERTIRNALSELEHAGFIEPFKERLNDGHTRRGYIIRPEPGSAGPELNAGCEAELNAGQPELGSGATGIKCRSDRNVVPVQPELNSGPIIRKESLTESINEPGGAGVGFPFRITDALGILFTEVPELKPQRIYQDRMGAEISTGLSGKLHQAFVQGFLEATKAVPPASRADVVVLAAWVKSGGLSWMDSKTTWLGYVCQNFPQLIDRAADWDRGGRQPISQGSRRTQEPPPTVPLSRNVAEPEFAKRSRMLREAHERGETIEEFDE